MAPRVVIRVRVAKSRFKIAANEMTLSQESLTISWKLIASTHKGVFMKAFRILIVLNLMLVGGIAFGMNVKTDYDRAFDFGRLKTFAFTDQKEAGRKPAPAEHVGG